jgi:PKD repeat protein
MKKIVIVFWSFMALHLMAVAQDSVQARVILIGSSGKYTNGLDPVLTAVKKNIAFNEKTTIIYLGNNLVKGGLPDNAAATYEIAKAPLDAQLQIAANTEAKVFFIPGTNEWAMGGSDGYDAVLRLQSFIDSAGNKNIKLLPGEGCPGPYEVKLSDDVVLVVMDSQWWLHEGDKPGVESDCPYKTQFDILVQLDDILADNRNKVVLLALHHTFRSNSEQAAYFRLKQHVFPLTDLRPNLYIPLPVAGSLYPFSKSVFSVKQNLRHPLYQSMITSIETVVKNYPYVIYVGGHDPSTQIIQDSGYNYITSGGGNKNFRVSKGSKSMYASSNAGFVTIEVSDKKKVQANVFQVEGETAKMDFSKHILDFSKPVKLEAEITRDVEYKFKDSVKVSASQRYETSSGFRRWFIGNNYRKEWNTPFMMREFNVQKEKGGFKIDGIGGGKQTKSLQLLDKDSTVWVIRSIEKDLSKGMPQNFKNSLAQEIAQDVLSASHPHGPLVVPPLARAVNVPTADFEFFYVPDDPALGRYRKLFANTVVMLENRNPGAGKAEVKSTPKLINKLLEDNDHHVDQEKVLNARLFDILIGDFDRHADQWKWLETDTGKGKLYIPLPRDRDQTFFNSDGFLLHKLSKRLLPSLQGFKSTIRNVNGFNFQSREVDRIFLHTLEQSTWERIAANFTAKMTDEVIDSAVKKFPEPIYAMDGKIIADKLKSRRNNLFTDALTYYRFISKVVTVPGSSKDEFFHIKNHPEGLQVTVYKKKDGNDTAAVMYKRVFQQDVTKEIRLFGLNGDDKFEIDRDASSKIKLRIIGGKGKDTFDLKGKIRNIVYDLSTEKNHVINLRRTNREFSSDPYINQYKGPAFKYNRKKFPQINIGFNPEDGLLLGAGFSLRTHGFRKEPFATDQKLTTLFAPARGAYRLKYEGIFNRVLFKNDLLINAQLVNPTIGNFFGLGNETVFDKSKGLEFHRVRYRFFEADLLMRKRFNEIVSFSVGPTYYQYWSKYRDNSKRILGNPAVIGTDSASIYGVKEYLGAKARFDIHFVNNEIFPTRGITWVTDFTTLYGFRKNSHNLSKLSSDVTLYASLRDPGRLGAIFRFGGGHIFSKEYEYFQALNLGAHNFLRGYRKNRFSGSSMAYASSELRLKLFKSKSFILPGDVGLMGFYETGRVWQKGEQSKLWHPAYGGGFYFIPYGVAMMSFTVGFSPEENMLYNFSLGTKIKLVF